MHSLVYLIRKTHYTIPGCVKIISTRSFKNFSGEQFLADVELIWWHAISPFSDPNGMWQVWKNQFLTCIKKQAPVKSKKNWEQEVPVYFVWVNMLCIKLIKRDFLIEKAEQTKDQYCWAEFKTATNEVNNSVKYARHKYLSEEPHC